MTPKEAFSSNILDGSFRGACVRQNLQNTTALWEIQHSGRSDIVPVIDTSTNVSDAWSCLQSSRWLILFGLFQLSFMFHEGYGYTV